MTDNMKRGYLRDWSFIMLPSADAIACGKGGVPIKGRHFINGLFDHIIELEEDIDSLKTEISEIVRVARDNPEDLNDFLMLNFPKDWGLTKMEHGATLNTPEDKPQGECGE